MKRIAILLICITVMIPSAVFARGERIGETEIKDDMLFIDGVSIPAAQLPNLFVYIPLDVLERYGFSVVKMQNTGEYLVSKLSYYKTEPCRENAPAGQKIGVYETDVKVYIESDEPANVFELEDGRIMVQSDELQKYGGYVWDEKTGTISINMAETCPSAQPFYAALGIKDKSDIAYGTIVNSEKECADIEPEELKRWLDSYFDFSYDRITKPMSPAAQGEYIKLWNSDKTKSYTVYYFDICTGSFGTPTESHGETKANYVWYSPYIGNARNALYIANQRLLRKYFDDTYEEYVNTKRPYTDADAPDKPKDVNLLNTNGCSDWAKGEIESAAAENLLTFDLAKNYQKPITRLEFCKLITRLIATEFEPKADSRTGQWSALEKVIYDKGFTETRNSVSYSDCDNEQVKILSVFGIISGLGDGTFAPEGSITREQAAVIIYNTAEFLGNKTMKSGSAAFSDGAEISAWANAAVSSVYEMGIMSGTGENKFSPKNTYTTEQAIATMLRLYNCY